jgi:hypothetical protein
VRPQTSPSFPRRRILKLWIGGSGQWRRLRCGYKKKPRGILTRYEVRPTPELRECDSELTRMHSDDGLTDANRGNNRRLLRGLGGQGRREQELQASRGGSGRRDHQSPGRAIPDNSAGAHHAVLRLLSRRKRMYVNLPSFPAHPTPLSDTARQASKSAATNSSTTTRSAPRSRSSSRSPTRT